MACVQCMDSGVFGRKSDCTPPDMAVPPLPHRLGWDLGMGMYVGFVGFCSEKS